MTTTGDLPAYGKRLIPQILDDLATSDPDRIIYSFAKSSDLSHGFQEISARTLAKAVNKTAWWLKSQVEESTEIQRVGYIGPHDLRQVILTYACVKAKCTALFLSPGNNIEGALAVLNAANCNIWVKPHGESAIPIVEEMIQKRTMQVLEIPALDEILDVQSVEPFPYTKTFEEALWEPFCILHTSGTTGVPKPIIWQNGLLGSMDAVRLLPPTEGDDGLLPWTADWKEKDRIYSSFPMSHGAGVLMDIVIPPLFGLHCILGPKGVVPNIDTLNSIAEYGKIDIWSIIPSLVNELGVIENSDVLSKFKSSKFICASGGPVNPSIVSEVNKVIRVLNLTGTTEGLFIGNLVVEREDWHWFAFHPYSGFEFKEIEPGVYEHWVHRTERWPLFQGLFYTFSDKDSVNLKDLYVRHPTKPNLWAFAGRSDDVVVLSNGYKIPPLDTEALITTHPAVKGCIVIGTGKPYAGLLIELKDPLVRNNKLFDSIWATVERANKLYLRQRALHKDYIALAEPNKPFICTDKGTVKRRATLELYADFIDDFYKSREQDDEEAEHIEIDTSSTESIHSAILNIMVPLLPLVATASSDTDLFSLGLDSLTVFKIVKTIRASTGLQDKLSPRHLYANPTLAKFSEAVAKLVKSKNAGAEQDIDAHRFRRTIEQYKARRPIKMNPINHNIQNVYMGMNFYFPLREDVSFEEAFAKLQAGLRRTFEFIPALEGKIMLTPEGEVGYKKKDLQVSMPSLASSAVSDPSSKPRQLRFKDLSDILPSFNDLRDAGFVASVIKDELVLDCPPYPVYPADVMVSQANFVKGGCILSTNFSHECMDGQGGLVAIRAWAENCRFLDGDKSATCSWLDPESFNHSLPEILHEQEGWARPAEEIDPKVWNFLPFFPPDSEVRRKQIEPIEPGQLPLIVPHNYNVWPAPTDGRFLTTTMFIIPPEKVELLQQEANSSLADGEKALSISNTIQAFYWRAAVKARYQVAKNQGRSFGPDEITIMESVTDGRSYFSALLPSSYMGGMLIHNRSHLPLDTLCSPQTNVGTVASLIRKSAARITPQLFHDAFTLLQSLPDFDVTRFGTASMGLDHMHFLLSNALLFQLDEISFGDGFFAEQGIPVSMRPQVERASGVSRFFVIYPMRRDGGVEMVLGTFPEELEALKSDPEFSKYATHMG